VHVHVHAAPLRLMAEVKLPTGSSMFCVTGASGFIGSHIVKQLLSQGYRVRGSVRDLKKEAKLAHLRSFSNAAQNLELVEADLQAGKYSELLKGCQILIHTATPYFYTANDPMAEIVKPAIDGTEDAIKGAIAAGVKRVVVTSSGGAIMHFPVPRDYVFTAKDWNTSTTLQSHPYFYSKTLAEQAAWRLYEQHKDKLELVVVNPVYVIGPTLSPILNSSLGAVRAVLMGENHRVPGAAYLGVVDVRDVAAAHILAAFSPKAVGQRLVACSQMVTWSSFYNKFKELFPQYPIDVNDPGPANPVSYDTQPLKDLGFPGYRDLETSIRDTVDAFVEQGIVPDLRK